MNGSSVINVHSVFLNVYFALLFLSGCCAYDIDVPAGMIGPCYASEGCGRSTIEQNGCSVISSGIPGASTAGGRTGELIEAIV